LTQVDGANVVGFFSVRFADPIECNFPQPIELTVFVADEKLW
jgi:hypothetical protein